MASPLLDRFGVPIPEGIRRDFEAECLLFGIVDLLGIASDKLLALFQDDSSGIHFLRRAQVAQMHLAEVVVYCVCPSCDGSKCLRCCSLGYLSKKQLERFPEKLQRRATRYVPGTP